MAKALSIKSRFNSVKSSVKSGYKSLKKDIANAYDVGYKSGWSDASKLPKRAGATKSAALGYHNGLKNHTKTNKYIARSHK